MENLIISKAEGVKKDVMSVEARESLRMRYSVEFDPLAKNAGSNERSVLLFQLVVKHCGKVWPEHNQVFQMIEYSSRSYELKVESSWSRLAWFLYQAHAPYAQLIVFAEQICLRFLYLVLKAKTDVTKILVVLSDLGNKHKEMIIRISKPVLDGCLQVFSDDTEMECDVHAQDEPQMFRLSAVPAPVFVNKVVTVPVVNPNAWKCICLDTLMKRKWSGNFTSLLNEYTLCNAMKFPFMQYNQNQQTKKWTCVANHNGVHFSSAIYSSKIECSHDVSLKALKRILAARPHYSKMSCDSFSQSMRRYVIEEVEMRTEAQMLGGLIGDKPMIEIKKTLHAEQEEIGKKFQQESDRMRATVEGIVSLESTKIHDKIDAIRKEGLTINHRVDGMNDLIHSMQAFMTLIREKADAMLDMSKSIVVKVVQTIVGALCALGAWYECEPNQTRLKCMIVASFVATSGAGSFVLSQCSAKLFEAIHWLGDIHTTKAQATEEEQHTENLFVAMVEVVKHLFSRTTAIVGKLDDVRVARLKSRLSIFKMTRDAFAYFLSLFKEAVDWLHEKVYGVPFFDNPAGVVCKMVTKYIEAASPLLTIDLVSELEKTPELGMELKMLEEQGNDLSKMISQVPGVQTYIPGFQAVHFGIRKMVSEMNVHNRINVGRPLPVCALFYGPTGVGKSTAVKMIIKAMHDVMDIDYTNASVYPRDMSMNFWDGYHNQNVVFYDDIWQYYDKDAMTLAGLEIIRLINCASMSIPVTDATQRTGGVWFKGWGVFATANVPALPAKGELSLQSMAALARRFQRVYYTTTKAEEANAGARRVKTDDLDYEQYVFYPSVFDKNKEQFVYDKTQRMTYEQVTEECLIQYADNQSKSNAVDRTLESNPKHLKEASERMKLRLQQKGFVVGDGKISIKQVDDGYDTAEDETRLKRNGTKAQMISADIEMETKTAYVFDSTKPALEQVAAVFTEEEDKSNKEKRERVEKWLNRRLSPSEQKKMLEAWEHIHGKDEVAPAPDVLESELKEIFKNPDWRARILMIQDACSRHLSKLKDQVRAFAAYLVSLNLRDCAIRAVLTTLTSLALISVLSFGSKQVYKYWKGEEEYVEESDDEESEAQTYNGKMHGSDRERRGAIKRRIPPRPKTSLVKKFPLRDGFERSHAQIMIAQEQIVSNVVSGNLGILAMHDKQRRPFAHHIVRLDDHHYVTVAHGIIHVWDRSQPLYLWLGGMHVEMHPDDMDILSDDKRDLCLIRWKKRLPTKYSHLIKFFMTEDDMEKSLGEVVSLVTFSADRKFLVEKTFQRPAYYGELDYDLTVDGVKTVINCVSVIRSYGVARGGDCSGVLVTHNSHFGNRCLIGLHVGSSNFMATSAVVTQEYLQGLIGDLALKIEKPTVAQVDVVISPITDENKAELSFDPKDLKSNVEILGIVKPAMHLPTKNPIQLSPMAGTLVEPTELPAQQKWMVNPDGVIVKPEEKGFYKVNRDVVDNSDHGLLRECMVAIMDSMPDWFENRVLTDEETVGGIEGATYLKNIEPGTSSGYPRNTEHRAPGKKAYIETVETKHGRRWRMKTDFYAEYQRMEYELKKGRELELAQVIWGDNKKVERLPARKVFDKRTNSWIGDTRLMSSGNLPLVLIARKYFGAFIENVMLSHNEWGCALGIDPHSKEWGMLAERLKVFGNNKFLAGDFKKFDASIAAIISKIVWEGIEMWYSNHPEWKRDDATVREELEHYTHQAVHLLGNLLYRVQGGNPSGQVLTTVENSLAVMLLMLYCAVKSARKAEKNWSIAQIWKMMVITSFGDDHVVAGSEELFEFFNMVIFAQMVKEEFGMEYTMIDKEAKIVPFLKFEDVRYLGRAFVEVDAWTFGPLDKEIIFDSINWMDLTNQTVTESMDATAQSCLIEMFAWGPEQFLEVKKKINKKRNSLNLPGVTLTWNDVARRVFAMESFGELDRTQAQMAGESEVYDPALQAVAVGEVQMITNRWGLIPKTIKKEYLFLKGIYDNNAPWEINSIEDDLLNKKLLREFNGMVHRYLAGLTAAQWIAAYEKDEELKMIPHILHYLMYKGCFYKDIHPTFLHELDAWYSAVEYVSFAAPVIVLKQGDSLELAGGDGLPSPSIQGNVLFCKTQDLNMKILGMDPDLCETLCEFTELQLEVYKLSLLHQISIVLVAEGKTEDEIVSKLQLSPRLIFPKGFQACQTAVEEILQ
jgi:energy-coupling factor transporter ATP-binding protein EcfA2